MKAYIVVADVGGVEEWPAFIAAYDSIADAQLRARQLSHVHKDVTFGVFASLSLHAKGKKLATDGSHGGGDAAGCRKRGT